MTVTYLLLTTKCQNIDKSLYIGKSNKRYQIRERETHKEFFVGTGIECYHWLEGYATALIRNSIG